MQRPGVNVCNYINVKPGVAEKSVFAWLTFVGKIKV